MYSHNPSVVVGNFTSTSRNVFLMSNVSVAIFALSTRLDGFEKNILLLCSVLTLTVSLAIGVNGVSEFGKYVDLLQKEKNVPFSVDLESWRNKVNILKGFLFCAGLVLLYFVIYGISNLKKITFSR